MHLDGKPWTFTRKFKSKKGQSRFLKRLDVARSYFPELAGETVKVGITINAPGKADIVGKGVFFRSRNVSNYVMGHELTHLLQGSGHVPKGERSCDLFTLARRVEFCDEAPNYIKVPRRLLDDRRFIRKEFRGMIHETAKAALIRRKMGRKNYIAWFEKELFDICGEVNSKPLEPPKRKKDNPFRADQRKLEHYFG